MTPIIWVLLLATAVVAIGIGAKFLAVRRARARARAVRPRPIDPACRINGHVYQEFDTGWRCATCGNHVARQDGELYGLVTDGRHERRREPR